MTSANTGAMLYQLSYEATHGSQVIFVGSIYPTKEIDERINIEKWRVVLAELGLLRTEDYET